MPDLRRQRRVIYHTKIRLRSPGREKSVVARVQNLSTRGVFVTATDLPEAGSEVLCRMLVAGERCTFKGLVAWVRPAGAEGASDGSPGAGIEFVGVSDREAQLLARLIQPDATDRQAVDVWFEGMGSPIKSHAAITDDALSISTKLPFLRLNSPVKVSFVRRGVEEVRSGILEAVTLEPSAEDGIPRLQVTVSTPQPDSAYGTIDVPGGEGGTTPVEAMLVREPRTVVSPMSIETPPPRPIAPAAVEMPPPEEIGAPAAEVRRKDHDRTPRVVRPTDPTLVPVPLPAPPAVREMGRGTRAAMAMVTLGVVGTLAFLLWDRSDHGTPALVAPPEKPKIEAQVERPRPKPTIVVPPAAPPPVIEKLDPPPVEDSEPGTMAIPLIGSARGMQFYKLAEPPGLVINLPHGYPKPGARVPGGAFKRLAIQRKGQGSQLRVYFSLDQNADVTAEGNGLRVVLRGKRAGKKA
jgi:Tfp pilus assembly protein PilZ